MDCPIESGNDRYDMCKVMIDIYWIIKRPLKKRCRIISAGGLGVPPDFKKNPPILGDIGG